MSWTSALSRFAVAFFVYGVLAAVVSMLAGWPAQFGRPGDPDNVFAEFLSRGTATAPPIAPLFLLGLAGIAARRAGGRGVLATVVLSVLGVAFVIGGLGEAFAPEPATAPRSVLIVGGGLAALGGVLLVILSVAAILERLGLPRHR